MIPLPTNSTVVGRDYVHTEKVVTKTVVDVKPGIEHITDDQAAILHEKIQELVTLHNLVKRRQVNKSHSFFTLSINFFISKIALHFCTTLK